MHNRGLARIYRDYLGLGMQPRAYQVFPLGLTWRHGYAVSLGVQETADLSEVAVPLDYVFDGGGFHQECVTAFPLDHSIHALDVARRKYRRLR